MAGTSRRLIAAAVVLAGLTAAGPASPVSELAGRYSWHFRNGGVGGSSYWSDDVVEIVPVDPTHAYVRLALYFYNGHECALAGVASVDGRGLAYRDTPADRGGVAGRCRLTIRRRGDQLTWNDADGGCYTYCGARGGFGGGHIAWASRRPITYLPRLRAAAEYRRAVEAWRSGGSVH